MKTAGQTLQAPNDGSNGGGGGTTTESNGGDGGGEEGGTGKITVLNKIHDEWVAAGSKNPSTEESKKLVASLTEAKAKVTKLEEDLAKAKGVLNKVAEKFARSYGTKQQIRIGGVVHALSCRGEVIYFKTKQEASVIDL